VSRLVSDPSRQGRGSPDATSSLSVDEIDADDGFGDGVLDLQARIHFEEMERGGVAVSFEEKLDGPGIWR